MVIHPQTTSLFWFFPKQYKKVIQNDPDCNLHSTNAEQRCFKITSETEGCSAPLPSGERSFKNNNSNNFTPKVRVRLDPASLKLQKVLPNSLIPLHALGTSAMHGMRYSWATWTDRASLLSELLPGGRSNLLSAPAAAEAPCGANRAPQLGVGIGAHPASLGKGLHMELPSYRQSKVRLLEAFHIPSSVLSVTFRNT